MGGFLPTPPQLTPPDANPSAAILAALGGPTPAPPGQTPAAPPTPTAPTQGAVPAPPPNPMAAVASALGQQAPQVQQDPQLLQVLQDQQQRQARLEQDRKTAQALLQKAMDPNGVFEYLPKPTASSILQDALYNIAQRNMNTGAKPIQMQRLAQALDLHKQKTQDILSAYHGLQANIAQENNAMAQERLLAGTFNKNAQVNAQLEAKASTDKMRLQATALKGEIELYDKAIDNARKARDSETERSLKEQQTKKLAEYNDVVNSLPDNLKALYVLKPPAAAMPTVRTSGTQMDPATGATRTVSTSQKVFPGIGTTGGTAPAGVVAPAGDGGAGGGVSPSPGGWQNINPKTIPNASAVKKDQEQVNRYNTALGRLASVMDNMDVLQSLPSALKVYMASEPSDFRSLLGRYSGLTDKQKQVAIDLNALREDVGLIRSGFNPGFRGDKAWAAMVNQVGNPLMDPAQMRGIMGTTMEAMIGMQAPAYQELARAKSGKPYPPKEVLRYYGLVTGWDGKPGTMTAAQRQTVKEKLASHGYDTSRL